MARVPSWESATEGRTVSVRYRQADGRLVETDLDRLVVGEVSGGVPVRDFRWYKGRRHYSGWYYAATVQRLVAYESLLELARILLADFDHSVVEIASQPFHLAGRDGDRLRHHVPDLLLVHADGLVTVVDVKAPSRMKDPKVTAQFTWTRRVCARRGWAYETWSGGDATVVENVRFLAGFRRPQLLEMDWVPTVLAAARGQSTVGGIEAALAGRLPVEVMRPLVLHLIWSGALVADLRRPLASTTTVKVAL
ncbi:MULTISPECIES: TnsA-like heteromeric transposase endonuclease subunit [unclassified Streptomyces]|uniref:TnsA-like heteromeric transposase endonuclease subunit n=1 Tax=unclassified Streptomyces TaxID=2593676 RepID=UPI000AF33DA7|nr:TnsA-like heteromeric transposase endonuclease subunit [Streptomyces sp. CCM_MD2014]